MTFYDILIIGAGPSGLFTALQAGRKTAKILILEKQPNPGLKLLLTGSGQCNFTNIRPIREFPQAYGEHGSFLKPALLHFSNQDAIAFFKQHGIEALVVEENGKVFPKSLQARDISRSVFGRRSPKSTSTLPAGFRSKPQLKPIRPRIWRSPPAVNPIPAPAPPAMVIAWRNHWVMLWLRPGPA
jgi:glycine/D-amino acid oxidase-like deaminating enzyme